MIELSIEIHKLFTTKLNLIFKKRCEVNVSAVSAANTNHLPFFILLPRTEMDSPINVKNASRNTFENSIRRKVITRNIITRKRIFYIPYQRLKLLHKVPPRFTNLPTKKHPKLPYNQQKAVQYIQSLLIKLVPKIEQKVSKKNTYRW